MTEIGRWFGASGLGLCGEKANCWINNWPALTIPFMATAVSIFLLRQHFATIPDELWDAARMDGSGHVRFLIQIVLPISKLPCSSSSCLLLLPPGMTWPAVARD